MTVAVASELLEPVLHLPYGAWLSKEGVPWEEYEALLEALGDDRPGKMRVFYDYGKLVVECPPAIPPSAADYVVAGEHLLPGMALCAIDVPWEVYEQLLEDLGEGYALRVFYNQGKMVIMPPLTYFHEKPKDIIHRLVATLSDELDIDVEFAGSTTLKKEAASQGAEPDTCFYVQHAAQLAGKRELKLDDTPPPDVVVEIDYTSLSADKFEIYAGLGVPEIWRWHKNMLRFYCLSGANYEEITHSRAFPFLDSATLTDFVRLGVNEGETKAAKAFRAWVREHAAA
jgi:Uma2 family endonuclease